MTNYEDACRTAYLEMCQRVGEAVYTPPPMPTVLYPQKARQLADTVIRMGLTYPDEALSA